MVTLFSSSQKSVATHSVKSSKEEPTASSSSVTVVSEKTTPTSHSSKSDIGSTASGENEQQQLPVS